MITNNPDIYLFYLFFVIIIILNLCMETLSSMLYQQIHKYTKCSRFTHSLSCDFLNVVNCCFQLYINGNVWKWSCSLICICVRIFWASNRLIFLVDEYSSLLVQDIFYSDSWLHLDNCVNLGMLILVLFKLFNQNIKHVAQLHILMKFVY